LKSADEIAECSYDNGSPTSVSKQRKITENTMSALDAPPAYTSAVVSVSEPAAAGSCKQESIGPEVVSSVMDLVGLDDDPSAFVDIWRTIDGSEFPLEFQMCLSESERDSSNLNFSSGELTCLTVSDVNDAVAEKVPATQQSSVDSGPSVQTTAFSCQSFQPLHDYTKYVNPPSSAPAVPIDNYSLQPWHQTSQVHEPLMHHLQLLLASVPTQQPDSCSELLKYYQVMQTKQHPGLKMQLQSHDTHSLSRTQGIQQQQQAHSNQLQSCYPTDMSAQHLQQCVMTPEHQPWVQPEWQMSAQCMPQTPQQLHPCQFVPTSIGVRSQSVKKEMPLSVIVSSATDSAARPHQQMLSVCSENVGHVLQPQYNNVTVAAPTRQSQSRINWQLN